MTVELIPSIVPTRERRTTCDLEVIVPALNEERRLPATLAALEAQLSQLDALSCRIVIVDNGSCDGTVEVVDQFLRTAPTTGVALVGCSQRGKGAAVRRGVVTGTARWTGFFDADCATPAEAVLDAVRSLQDGAHVVIASRRVDGARYAVAQSGARRLASWVFNRSIADLVPQVKDTQCGFKFFSRQAAADIFADLEITGFTFDVELLVRARTLGYEIHEMPVVWTDGDGSSLNALAEAPQIMREIVRLRRVCRAIVQPPSAPSRGR